MYDSPISRKTRNFTLRRTWCTRGRGSVHYMDEWVGEPADSVVCVAFVEVGVSEVGHEAIPVKKLTTFVHPP